MSLGNNELALCHSTGSLSHEFIDPPFFNFYVLTNLCLTSLLCSTWTFSLHYSFPHFPHHQHRGESDRVEEEKGPMEWICYQAVNRGSPDWLTVFYGSIILEQISCKTNSETKSCSIEWWVQVVTALL